MYAEPETGGLELTEDNVEMVLDEIRPYLMAGTVLLAHTASLLHRPGCSDRLLHVPDSRCQLYACTCPALWAAQAPALLLYSASKHRGCRLRPAWLQPAGLQHYANSRSSETHELIKAFMGPASRMH